MHIRRRIREERARELAEQRARSVRRPLDDLVDRIEAEWLARNTSGKPDTAGRCSTDAAGVN